MGDDVIPSKGRVLVEEVFEKIVQVPSQMRISS